MAEQKQVNQAAYGEPWEWDMYEGEVMPYGLFTKADDDGTRQFILRPEITGEEYESNHKCHIACSRANATRIVACVNALQGLNPSAVARVVEALEAVKVASLAYEDDQVDASDRPSSWGKLANLLEAAGQARQALAALRGGEA